MKRERFEDWARGQFLKLLPEEGDQVWNDGEELLRRKRLLEFLPQEGRITARFSGEKPVRCQLVAPVFSDEDKRLLFTRIKNSTLASAQILSERLPWNTPEMEKLLSPASFIPLTPSGAASGENLNPERYNSFAAAAYIEFLRRAEQDPAIAFTLRDLDRAELIANIREHRIELWSQVRELSDEEKSGTDLSVATVESAKPHLFELTYQLRADELPALLFKRVEGIPLNENGETVDSVLTDLYAHIAKRAQAYGLSLSSRVTSTSDASDGE